MMAGRWPDSQESSRWQLGKGRRGAASLRPYGRAVQMPRNWTWFQRLRAIRACPGRMTAMHRRPAQSLPSRLRRLVQARSLVRDRRLRSWVVRCDRRRPQDRPSGQAEGGLCPFPTEGAFAFTIGRWCTRHHAAERRRDRRRPDGDAAGRLAGPRHPMGRPRSRTGRPNRCRPLSRGLAPVVAMAEAGASGARRRTGPDP